MFLVFAGKRELRSLNDTSESIIAQKFRQVGKADTCSTSKIRNYSYVFGLAIHFHEHLNNWNKGRLHAYNTLLLKLKELNSAEILEFAKCEAESVRLGEYSAFNSGMYEVYRTFSTIDMKQLVQSERLKTKPKYNN